MNKIVLNNKVNFYHIMLLLVFLAVFIWSAINPKDFFTWFLEVLPAIIGVIIIILTYSRFRLTSFVYTLILIHTIVLMIGGHYTYAEMPLFNWLKNIFGLSRNHYDRLGHFVQGFIPALISREILIRKSIVKRGKMLFFIVTCICLAISASYELIEWGVAEATGSAADAFLGTQGDVWDTQWDMFFALIGAIISLSAFTNIHDRFINEIDE